MPSSPPPFSLAWQVDRLVPGVYGAFVSRVSRAASRRTTLTSWWRDPTGNARVGGNPDSQHLIALAADLGGEDFQDLARRLRSSGLVAVVESNHVHVQLWPAGTARRIGLLAAVGL